MPVRPALSRFIVDFLSFFFNYVHKFLNLLLFTKIKAEEPLHDSFLC